MAEDVVEHAVAVPQAEPEALVEPRRPREQPRIYRFRFGIAYLALAVVAGLGVGGAILLYERPTDPEEPAWSSWRPTGRETSYPDQIADYVGGRYRLPSGRQLAVVAASAPRVTTGQPVPVQAVIIQNQSPLPSAAPNFEYVRTDNTIMYELCGLGQQCSISEGEPSTERFQLLRREALELSLYTFKYVEGAESTIVMLPPNLGEDPEDASDDEAVALFLQKKDFARELAQPVRNTLLRATAPTLTRLNPREDLVVSRLTDPNIFRYQFQQAPTGGALVLLAPVNARR